MNIYKSIMQGLSEAVEYQQGKVNARITVMIVKATAERQIVENKEFTSK